MMDSFFEGETFKSIDFTLVQFAEGEYENGDLSHSVFENSELESTDFRTAENFSINPSTNNLKKAQFSSSNIKGLLDSFDISIV